MAHEINPAHYDGRRHKVPYEVGPDFGAKYSAYRDEGFAVAIGDGTGLIVAKLMEGECPHSAPKAY